MLVVCELGAVTVDPRKGTFMEINGKRSQLHSTTNDDIQKAFTAQLADFSAAVGGAAPSVSGEHATHVVELVLAAYDSAESGAPVRLDAVLATSSPLG